MNPTLFGVIALLVFVSGSSCDRLPHLGRDFMSPYDPSIGMMISQEAQKNAADTVVDNAIIRAGSTQLPPEFQVIFMRIFVGVLCVSMC